MRESRIYLYKIPFDTGGAPCVTPGKLTLAICKPAIRRTARQGDIIFAFGTNDQVPPNRLVYIAEITKRLSNGEYYDSKQFQRRKDCIYKRQNNGKFVRRKDAKFHADSDERARDLGEPLDYDNANVLISTDFRYFGGSGKSGWKKAAPELKALVENLGQGHRVYHAHKVLKQLRKLKERVWANHDEMKIGRPLHGGKSLCEDPADATLELGSDACGYL